MRAGDPTPQTCVNWERACRKYVNNKDIAADKVVKHTLDGIEDVRFIYCIELDHTHFEVMTLDEFMVVFRKNYITSMKELVVTENNVDRDDVELCE